MTALELLNTAAPVAYVLRHKTGGYLTADDTLAEDPKDAMAYKRLAEADARRNWIEPAVRSEFSIGVVRFELVAR